MDKKKIIIGLILALVILITAGIALNSLKKGNEEQQSAEDNFYEEMTETEKRTEEEVIISEDGEEESALYEALRKMLDGESYEEALEQLKMIAASGNADAMYLAGEMYLQGLGTQKDITQAANYLGQACNQGNINAFGIYAKLLFMGDGIWQDYEKARDYFTVIADTDSEACCALGIMYALGMGVPIDYEKANMYLDAAAEAGNQTANTMKTAISGLSGKPLADVRETESVAVVKRIEYSQEHQDMAELIEKLCKKLQESEQYDDFTRELGLMAQVKPAVAAGTTIFGKNNWLFLQNPVDGDSLHDYIGDNAYTEDEMKAIAVNLTAWRDKIEQKGSRFILMFIPNKEIIYQDKMPSYIKRKSEATRTDKLVDYLRENTDLTIMYAKDNLMELKNKHQLYYATDTHCNMMGSFVVLSQLINTLYGKSITLDENRFVIHTDTYAGDLSVMLGRTDRYAIDKVYFLPEQNVAVEDKIDASMTLVGDSFSEFLSVEAEYYFMQGVEHVMIGDYGFDYGSATDSILDSTSNDIVVWECVERYIDRMK